ncbi:hypothetical protein BST61_g10303 [Cercospora zeina]
MMTTTPSARAESGRQRSFTQQQDQVRENVWHSARSQARSLNDPANAEIQCSHAGPLRSAATIPVRTTTTTPPIRKTTEIMTIDSVLPSPPRRRHPEDRNPTKSFAPNQTDHSSALSLRCIVYRTILASIFFDQRLARLLREGSVADAASGAESRRASSTDSTLGFPPIPGCLKVIRLRTAHDRRSPCCQRPELRLE